MIDAGALSRRIARRTAVAWVVGVVALAALCVGLGFRGQALQLDQTITGDTGAAFGLATWDDGEFTAFYLDTTFDAEDQQQMAVVTAEGVLWGTGADWQAAVLAEVIETREEYTGDVGDLRVSAAPLWDEDFEDADDYPDPIGAAIVWRSRAEADEAAWAFARVVLLATVGLIVLGLITTQRLARRILTAFEASIAERERILAGAAHELRTPMATVLTTIDAGEPHEAAETLSRVRGTVARTGQMVDRLLVWSRLAHDQPDVERVRLDLLVELCLRDDEPFEAEATVVDADPRLIEVAVTNLLENARAHGGGVARVTVSDGRIEVHDHGPGITDDGLLAPFTKGRESRGTGLGLALVQRIAEKHGGRLEVRPVIALELPVPAA